MNRMTLSLALAFVMGCAMTCATISGCSRAADRTLTLYQFQSSNTMLGAFRVDSSKLPANAIQTTKTTGNAGGPETRMTLNPDYDIEIVLQLANPPTYSRTSNR